MVKKQKVMATPSCSEVDRFSDLPNGVAHHIISFLNIPDVARFGCVSKRCGRLYMSTPTLKFEGFPVVSFSTSDKRLRLFNALDRLMSLRGDDKIHTLCVRDSGRYVKSRIINWIHNALRCNVEVLDFKLGHCTSVRMSSAFDSQCSKMFQSVLLCGSLKSLSMESEYMYRFLTLPSFASFSNIECLKLKNIHVVDEGFFRWISSSCKCIKELHLEKVDGIEHLTIESSSLQSFSFVHRLQLDPLHLSISADSLQNVVIDWGFQDCRKVLNISAPKVSYMKWTGNLLIQQYLGEFKLLEKAKLYLRPGENDLNILSEFINSICKVQSLIMNEETVKALFENGSKPAPLDNVCQLQMHVKNFYDDVIPAMVFLFKGLSNLSTLYISSEPIFFFPRTKSSGYNVAYWELLNLAFVNKLEEVTIELPNGSNGIELALYRLDHAQSLKKMVIVHSPEQSSFKRKLLKRKKISSVRVVFQEDQIRGTTKQVSRRVPNRG